MDKTGIIVVSICALLLGWWFIEQNKIAQQVAQQQALFARTNPAAITQNQLPATNSNPVSATMTASPVTLPVIFDTNSPERIIVLTNAKARYTFTSRGGGLKLIELLDYPQTVSARWTSTNGSQANGVASLNMLALVPSLAVLGDASLVGDGNFALAKTADGVRMEKSFTSGLRLVKEFHVGSNYLVHAIVRWENTTDKPLNLPVQEVVVGTATPMDADDNGQAEGAMWSDGLKASDLLLASFSGGGCSRGAPRTEIVAGSNNVVWAATHNQFFALMAI